MYRDTSHPSRNRCPSPPPYVSPDDQVWKPPVQPKIDQQAILRCMRGSKPEVWGNIGFKPKSEDETKVGQGDTKKEDTVMSGPFSRGSAYSTELGGGYSSSFSSFLNSRNRRFGMMGSYEQKPKPKPTWKAAPPTFKFKTGDEASDMEDEKPSSEEESEAAAAGMKRPNDDDYEWIQSPFCGDRYRKKDVDLLVAFANRYIKSANESMAKRRKTEETGQDSEAGVTEDKAGEPGSGFAALL